jgi:putative PIN family toxin of toxin-antitoxin system
MKSDRLVIDTNVFISGLIWPSSVPGRALDEAVARSTLLANLATFEELVTTLLADKFDSYMSRSTREAALDRLMPILEFVETIQIVRACRDSRDDKFLEAAVNGRADVIITGDKDLLVLHPFAGVSIMTPADYLAAVERVP